MNEAGITAQLREAVKDLLADSADASDGENRMWLVNEEIIERLCRIAGMGSVISTLDEMEREALAAPDQNTVKKPEDSMDESRRLAMRRAHTKHKYYCTCGMVVGGNGAVASHAAKHERLGDGHRYITQDEYERIRRKAEAPATVR